MSASAKRRASNIHGTGCGMYGPFSRFQKSVVEGVY